VSDPEPRRDPPGDAAETERFGELAIQEGYITQEQLGQALSIQDRMRDMGIRPKLLGEILNELGHLDGVGRDRILQVLKKRKGRFVIEGFEILEKLGQGSGGAVFKARQQSLDRVVALKILRPRLAENEAYLARFIKEAQAVARLNHVNLISAYEVGESNGYRYLVMEYVDGVTLARVLARGGAMDELRSLRVIQQIARALDHAHKHDLVHRDVKPDNIILTEGGVAKLCDLGLAKDLGSSTPQSSRIGTHGTPYYISPEQVRGDTDVDIRSDVYSLGATLFHTITGEVPFSGATPAEVMARHLNERPRDPKVVAGVSPEVSRLVTSMMAKRRLDRPQSPAEIVDLIEAILALQDPTKLSPAQIRAPEPKIKGRRDRRRG
jgi:serine/threonine-protein kinase